MSLVMSEVNENIIQSTLHAVGKIGKGEVQESSEKTRRRGLQRIGGAVGTLVLGAAIGAWSIRNIQKTEDMQKWLDQQVGECTKELAVEHAPELLPLPDSVAVTRTDDGEILVSQEIYCESVVVNHLRQPGELPE